MQFIDQHYPGFSPIQVGHQACEKSWSYGPGVRPYWLLHYIHRGKGILRIDGVTHPVRKGNIFVIPAYAEAYYRADEQDPWEYSWIGFLADSIPEDALSQPIIHCPSASRIFNDMCRCGYMGNGKIAYLCSRLWELLSIIIDERDDVTPPNHIDEALNYMNTHYDSGITISDVARQLHLDRTYFATLFKKRVGLSPVTYLTNLRMNQAAQLIRCYGKTPTIASLSVGYSDYCHFSRAFKKHFGCSPRQYATNHEKNDVSS